MSNNASPFDAVAELPVRLANIVGSNGLTLAAEHEGGMLDLAATALSFGLPVPAGMDELLQSGGGAQIQAILAALAQAPEKAAIVSPESVTFAPLVTKPEKILCVGFNYRKHAEETNTPIPKEPPLFSKFRNALSAHNAAVVLPVRIDYQFDFETELVIVFGRRGKDIAEADALNYVAGYTVGNDLSARQRQTATTQFLAGKAADGFAPLGPWFTPRSRVANPNNLQLQTRVNGVLRQDWTTADMIFSCRRLIAYISRIMTIEPGDILFTGTPQGVIFGEKAPPEDRRWLRAGDEVLSEIEGLGRLRVILQ